MVFIEPLNFSLLKADNSDKMTVNDLLHLNY